MRLTVARANCGWLGDHPRQLGARVGAGARLLAGEDERRLVHALRPRELALGQGQERRVVAAVVALGQVVDVQVAVDVARLVVPVADEPRLAEERRHREELVAGAVGEVAVDVLEVQRAVVARDARGVEPEEHAADVDGQRVDVVEPVGDAVVVDALDEPALQLVAAADHGQRRDGRVDLGRGRQHVVHELVVGPIDASCSLNQ